MSTIDINWHHLTILFSLYMAQFTVRSVTTHCSWTWESLIDGAFLAVACVDIWGHAWRWFNVFFSLLSKFGTLGIIPGLHMNVLRVPNPPASRQYACWFSRWQTNYLTTALMYQNWKISEQLLERTTQVARHDTGSMDLETIDSLLFWRVFCQIMFCESSSLCHRYCLHNLLEVSLCRCQRCHLKVEWSWMKVQSWIVLLIWSVQGKNQDMLRRNAQDCVDLQMVGQASVLWAALISCPAPEGASAVFQTWSNWNIT